MAGKTFILALLCILVTVPAGAVLVNNGGFDTNAAGWGFAGGPGQEVPTEEATGGNPGGYVTIETGPDNWATWYQTDTEYLTDLGIPAGTVVTYQCDMIDLGGAGLTDQGGFKAESWQGGGTKLTPGDGVDVYFDVTSSWETYSFDYTMEDGTDNLKFILVNVTYDPSGDTAKYGFDNAEITIPGGTPALRPIPSVGAGLAAANDVLSWVNPDPNSPGDTVTADVYILESDVALTDPNMGPLDPGVILVAFDTADEFVDLSDAGFTVEANKYYYWKVDVVDSDPAIGVIEGFEWNFQTADSPPSDVSAGVDQYLWLTTGGVKQFTLTGSYANSGPSPLVILWEDISNPLDQAPGTTVTINSPDSAVTTVDVSGDGWFLFSLTVSDDIGSGTDEVNVGVYVDACAAANADPDDIAATYPGGHGDIDGDCDTDLTDFALMASSWMECMSDKLVCP
jgi:hypothetical protein